MSTLSWRLRFYGTHGTPCRNGSSDVTALPVPCAQLNSDGDVIGTEDCLSMVLYVPTSISKNSEAPTFMWYVYSISCCFE